MDPIANGPLNGSFNGPLPANIVQLRKHFERLHATGGDAAVRPTLCGALKYASPSQASTSSSPVPPPAPTPAPRSEKHSDPATRQYFDHSMGTRINTDALITRSLTVSAWCSEVRNEILVYDGGWWQRSAELWDSVQSAKWENVILDESMKEALINDHLSFFNSHDTYEKLHVPWKRGIIYHGPPGNGKTITIKATMRMLQSLDPYVPTLYVRSLDSWSGPSAAISHIFNKAREFAPCYLVLEDIDTIITDDVRSYFLNELVDHLVATNPVWPLWLCPLPAIATPTFHPATDPPGAPSLNVGVWGRGPKDLEAFVRTNRDLEAKVRALGGRK
ncbi:hypothetical protein BN1723_016420, partial [Verticillium longisporum]